MPLVKRSLFLMLAGAVLGEGVATLGARAFIPWYNSPGEAMGASPTLCNLQLVTRSTIDNLVRDQLIGALVGAIVVWLGGLLVGRALHKRAAAAAPSGGA